jgi:hypothetical protein
MRLIFILFYFVTLNTYAQSIELGINYVNAKSLNVRSQPSKKSKVIDKKIFRQGVDVLEIKGDWARIYFYNGSNSSNKNQSRWVHVKYLSKVQPDPIPTKFQLNFIREHIPRSSYEQARYWLLYIEKRANTFMTIHERESEKSIAYTKTEINCSTEQYKFLGDSIAMPDNLYLREEEASNWVNIVPGSSKSDLLNYVCHLREHIQKYKTELNN